MDCHRKSGSSLLKNITAIALSFIVSFVTYARVPRDSAVEISATISRSPAKITLSWTPVPNESATYRVDRLANDEWQEVQNSSSTSYEDSNVAIGTKYEYRVVKTVSDYTGYGYISAGIDIPPVHDRGTIILVISDDMVSGLSSEISRLEGDLVGDGWTVRKHAVSTSLAPIKVRDIINSDFQDSPSRVTNVFLIGNVPIVYSGYLNPPPDGHQGAQQGHEGAWPADVFYANLDQACYRPWSDLLDFGAGGGYGRSNNAGDGKYDPSVMLADLEIGRVDLRNMTSFAPATHEDLLRRYLNKNHKFRHGILSVTRRALVDDNWGLFPPALPFGANAWQNFGPLLGSAQVSAGDWFGTNDYLWGYGAGPGWFTGASGVGNTIDFATNQSRVVFAMLFGSYFGDWDSEDNFLRAPLCSSDSAGESSYGLAAAWTGFPFWFFHHMALGNTIGYSTKVTQNNFDKYASLIHLQEIHIALMGDPSLRMHVVSPVSTGSVNRGTSPMSVQWTAPSPTPSGFIGYYVYRAATPLGPFSLAGSTPVSGTSYTLPNNEPANQTYMVRVAVLESTPSGTYTNLSEGVIMAPTANISPIMVDQPVARTVIAGSALSLTARAWGNPAPTYQWYKNGSAISGATGPDYLVASSSSGDAGSYAVTASNSGGSASSTAASITIAAQTTANADNYTIDEGTTTDFNVLSNDSGSPLSIMWHTDPIYTPPLNAFYSGCTVNIVNNLAHFVARPGFFGSTCFRYGICDGIAPANAVVTVTVQDTSIDPGAPFARHSLQKFGLQGVGLSSLSLYGYSRELADHTWEVTSPDAYGVNHDSAWFEHMSLVGDFSIAVRVRSVTEFDSMFPSPTISEPDLIPGVGGIMIRDGITVLPGSFHSDRFLRIGFSSHGKLEFGSRTTANGDFNQTELSSPALSTPNVWLGMQRVGNTLTMYASSDGQSWQQISSSQTFTDLPEALEAGLFCTSGDFEQTRAVFSDFQPFRLVSPARLGNGSFQFDVVGGAPSGTVYVDYSSDLQNWSSLGTVTLGSGGTATVTDSSASSASRRFYRAKSGFLRSPNTVGFYSKSIPAGMNYVGNQIKEADTTLEALFPSPSGYATSYKPVGNTFEIGSFDTEVGWDPPGLTLKFGEATYFENNSTSFVNYFVGELMGGVYSVSIPGGQNAYVTPYLPKAGGLQTVLEFTPTADDTVYITRGGTTYISAYDSEIGWDPAEPQVQVGDAMIIQTSTTKTWTQHFKLWP